MALGQFWRRAAALLKRRRAWAFKWRVECSNGGLSVAIVLSFSHHIILGVFLHEESPKQR